MCSVEPICQPWRNKAHILSKRYDLRNSPAQTTRGPFPLSKRRLWTYYLPQQGYEGRGLQHLPRAHQGLADLMWKRRGSVPSSRACRELVCSKMSAVDTNFRGLKFMNFRGLKCTVQSSISRVVCSSRGVGSAGTNSTTASHCQSDSKSLHICVKWCVPFCVKQRGE